MAEARTSRESAKDGTKEPTKDGEEEGRALGSAAASIDPSVQYLLAERAAAELNGDKAAIAEINAKLADLGVN